MTAYLERAPCCIFSSIMFIVLVFAYLLMDILSLIFFKIIIGKFEHLSLIRIFFFAYLHFLLWEKNVKLSQYESFRKNLGEKKRLPLQLLSHSLIHNISMSITNIRFSALWIYVSMYFFGLDFEISHLPGDKSSYLITELKIKIGGIYLYFMFVLFIFVCTLIIHH